MDIEKINDNVIRVTITLSDLEERDIDIDALAYSSPEAKELFDDMIEQAELELGFNMADSQIIIEPVPDSYEGFIITISKLDEESEMDSIHRYIKSKLKKSDAKTKSKKKTANPVLIYRIDNFDNLCVLCGKLKKIYAGKNSVYKCDDSYYLVLGREKFLSLDTIKLESLLQEYGHRLIHPLYYQGYLNEYGCLIVKDKAIETLSKHFK